MSRNDKAQRETWHLAESDTARWIFPERPADTVNQFADFLHDFDCDASVPHAELRISADTDFAVWLNGEFIGQGQYSNYPNAKTYELFSLSDSLIEGRNRLAVTVFYNGRTSSVYERGEPGLLFELRGDDALLAASGTGTLCRSNPCYHSGPIAIVSGQLAYTFGYDARDEGAFQHVDYSADEEWRWILASEASTPADRSSLLPRPVPRLIDAGSTETRLVEAGRFKFDTTLAESVSGSEPKEQTAAGLTLAEGPAVSPAWQMHNAQLSPVSTEELVNASAGSLLDDLKKGLRVDVEDLDGRDGIYLVFDLGQEEVGHLELDIDAEEGTIADIGYGEHLDDGRVRTFVGGRNFAGRYICRSGRQRFDHRFLRWAGRYLQIHVYSSKFTIHRLSLRRCDYPVQVKGEITTDKELHSRLAEAGCRTLHLCMHEHYEDTPWREQALYANDARTQALCGYYAFGETAMPAASFSLLGNGLRSDGFINLTAPARPPLTIPSFTFAWILAVRDHYLYSGDDRMARQFLPQICSMLKVFLDERKNGLLPLRQVKGIWHFYDWSAGMSGYSKEEFEHGLEADLPLNGYFILAIEAAEQMLAWCGEDGGEELAKAAGELRDAAAERFWDTTEKVFHTHEHRKRLTELTQSLAVLAGIGDTSMREAVLERLASPDSGLSEPGLSQSYYTFEALMTRKDKYGAEVLRRIEKIWGMMLDAGSTTFWETITGASDFNNAGSLCHGWSAVPVYVLYHDVLGVRPLEPGFSKFTVEPLSQAVSTCSGRVPVPGGEIAVSWAQPDGDNTNCTVTAPEGLNYVEKR